MVATDSMKAHGSPARRPGTLDEAMENYAGRKHAPPLRPSLVPRPQPDCPSGHGIVAQVARGIAQPRLTLGRSVCVRLWFTFCDTLTENCLIGSFNREICEPSGSVVESVMG